MAVGRERREAMVVLSLLVVIVALSALLVRQRSSGEVAFVAAQPLSDTISAGVVEGGRDSIDMRSPQLIPFDPNTVELRELLLMGLTRYQALSLLRYRAAGKRFRIKEELIECNGIGDSLYFVLEPYITIGEEYRYKPRVTPTAKSEPDRVATRQGQRREITPRSFDFDTVSASFFVEIGALSYRQAEVLIARRDMMGLYSLADLRECYVVDDSVATILDRYATYQRREPRIEEASVNLNSVDSVGLVALPGIGPKSASAIVRYREALGGFHSITQLFEIPIINEKNFSVFNRYFFINLVDLLKIDVNFASAEELARHPYFLPATVRKIIKTRNSKGGWSNIAEMVEDDIFNEEEAQHVHPYLYFYPINRVKKSNPKQRSR